MSFASVRKIRNNSLRPLPPKKEYGFAKSFVASKYAKLFGAVEGIGQGIQNIGRGFEKPSENVSVTDIKDKLLFNKGNIDILDRPQVKNEDGSVSTVLSKSFNIDGKEILMPTIVNGKKVSDEEAIKHYKETGENFGKFDTIEESNKYAERLHKQQESKLKADKLGSNVRKAVGAGIEAIGMTTETVGKEVKEAAEETGWINPFYEKSVYKDDGSLDVAYMARFDVLFNIGSDMMAQMIPGLTFSALTGSPVPMMASMGLMSTGMHEQEYLTAIAKERGVTIENLQPEDREKAETHALYAGIGEAVLETLPLLKYFKGVPGGKKITDGFLKGIVKVFPKALMVQIFEEGGTEAIQQVYTNALAKYSGIDPKRDLMDGVVESAYGGAAGGLFFGFAGGVREVSSGIKVEVIKKTTKDVVKDELKVSEDVAKQKVEEFDLPEPTEGPLPPEEEIRQMFKQIPAEERQIIAQATERPMNPQGVAQLSEVDRSVMGTFLTMAKDLPGADRQTIQNNIDLITKSGVEIQMPEEQKQIEDTKALKVEAPEETKKIEAPSLEEKLKRDIPKVEDEVEVAKVEKKTAKKDGVGVYDKGSSFAVDTKKVTKAEYIKNNLTGIGEQRAGNKRLLGTFYNEQARKQTKEVKELRYKANDARKAGDKKLEKNYIDKANELAKDLPKDKDDIAFARKKGDTSRHYKPSIGRYVEKYSNVAFDMSGDSDAKISKKDSTFEEARRVVRKIAKRLKITNLEVAFFDKILTGDGMEEAIAAAHGNEVALTAFVREFTAQHEVMHVLLRNISKFKELVDKGVTAKGVLAEIEAKYGIKNIKEQDEKLAQLAEIYFGEKKGAKPKGMIKKFFDGVMDWFQRITKEGKDGKSQIETMMEFLYEGEGQENVQVNEKAEIDKADKYIEKVKQKGTKGSIDSSVLDFTALVDRARSSYAFSRKSSEGKFAEYKEMLSSMGEEVEGGLAKISQELDQAEAGERIFTEAEKGGAPVVTAQKSTFPKWMPEGTRTRKTIDKVTPLLDSLDTLKLPKNKDELALMSASFDRLDSVLEINTEDIRKDIFKQRKKEIAETLVTPSGKLDVKKVFSESWKKLYGEEAPVLLTDLLKRAPDKEVIEKGYDVSYKEGKKDSRNKATEARQKERAKGAAKLKDLRAELNRRWKNKVGTADEMRKLAVEYIKAAVPAKFRGKYLTAVKNVKTKKNFDRLMLKVDKQRKSYERQLLATSITNLTKNIDKLPVDIQRSIIEITANLELKKHTKKLLKRLRSTKEHLDKQANDFEMPRRVLNELGILKKTPFENIPTEQLIRINNQLQQYQTVGKNIMQDKKARVAKVKADKLDSLKDSKNLDTIDLKEKLHPFKSENIGRTKQEKEKYSRLQLALIGIDRLFNRADGMAEYKGPNFKIFKEPIDKLWNVWQKDEDKIKMSFYKMINEMEMTRKNSKNISIYAYNKQRGGRKKLMKDHGMTADEIDAIKLTEDEMQIYKWMRKELDAMHAKLTEKMKNENNTMLGRVDNYFPMMTDFAVTKPLVEEMAGEGKLKAVPFGNIHERKEYAGQLLQMDAFGVFESYIGKSTYFIAMDAKITELSAIARDGRYNEAVGNDMQNSVLTWLDVLARKGGSVKQPAKWLKEVNEYNNKLSIVVLGYRITTIVKQPLALLDGAGEIGSYAFSGVQQIIQPEWRSFIKNNSSEMRNRVGGDPSYQELAAQLKDEKLDGKASVLRNRVQEHSMKYIKMSDSYTAGAVWTGAYTKKMDELGLPVDLKKPNEEALLYADRIVRITQSSGNFKDLPLAMVNDYRMASKLIFKFQNFMLNRWSYISEDLPDHMKNNKKLAVQQLMFVSLAMMMEAGISSLYHTMMWGRDDDDEEKMGMAEAGSRAMIASMIQTVPIVGSIFSSFIYGSNPIALVEIVNKTFKSLKATGTSKKPSTKTKHAIRSISYIVGIRYGLPTDQARSLVEKWLFGGEDPAFVKSMDAEYKIQKKLKSKSKKKKY